MTTDCEHDWRIKQLIIGGVSIICAKCMAEWQVPHSWDTVRLLPKWGEPS